MLRVFLCTCVMQVAMCIIVTDAPPPKAEYKYSYEIVDPTTGDTKSLYEAKHGDVVRGSYSVVDPDGTKRIVDYTAGAGTGFKAVIRNEVLPDPHSNNVHGIPYSSLYDARNFNIKPYNKHKFLIPIQYVEPVQNNHVTLFRPGAVPSTEEQFAQGEFFKPTYHK